MNFRPIRSLGGLFAAFAVSSAGAASGELPFFEDLPQVLTASRLPQPLHEAPGAVTVIDRETILATGYRDLARVFRLVPGMQVGQERGHAQWVTYHGLSNDNPTEMQVLIDGRSVITASAFGGVDWSALPLTLDEIDRIEIVRGTNASSFGANAFLGVINIITRHSADGTRGNGAVRAGSGGVRDAAVGWSGGGDDLSLRVTAESQRDDGFEDLNDRRRIAKASVRGDWQLSPQDSLLLRAAATTGRRGEGYPDSIFGNNAPRETDTDAHTLHLQWRRSPGAGEEWLVNYYRNHERITDEWVARAPPLFPVVPLDRNRESERDDIELQHRSTPSPTLQLVWGGEARRDRVDSPFVFFSGNPDPQYLYRLFGTVEWRVLAPLTLNLGGAHEKYSGEPDRFSPRAFANWQATPDDTLRLGYSRAWRQRIPFELFGDVRATDPASGAALVRPFLPNPDLRQTRIDAVELGYFGRFETWSTTFDVRAFNERIRDFIVRVPQADPEPAPLLSPSRCPPGQLGLGSTRYENLDRPLTLRGIEYQLVTRPRPGTEFRAAHSLIDRRSREGDIGDRSAPYTASVSWLQDYGGGWTSMLSVLRSGPLAGGDGYVPSFRYVARPYTTVDVSIRYATRLGGTPLTFAITALNLGDEHQEIADRTEQALPAHREHPANLATRSVYFTASVALD